MELVSQGSRGRSTPPPGGRPAPAMARPCLVLLAIAGLEACTGGERSVDELAGPKEPATVSQVSSEAGTRLNAEPPAPAPSARPAAPVTPTGSSASPAETGPADDPSAAGTPPPAPSTATPTAAPEPASPPPATTPTPPTAAPEPASPPPATTPTPPTAAPEPASPTPATTPAEPETQEEVNLEIEVKERKLRELKVGGGFASDQDWQELFANVRYKDLFFAGYPLQLNLLAQVGWVFKPDQDGEATSSDAALDPDTGQTGTPGENGPTADLDLNLSLPYAIAERISLSGEARLLVEQARGYATLSPQLRLAADSELTPDLDALFGLGLARYRSFFDTPAQATATLESPADTTPDGIRFDGLLTYLEQQLTYDGVDRSEASRRNPFATLALQPQSGLFAALMLQEAGEPGDYAFVKVLPEVRGYYPVLRDRLILTGRLSTGVIFPLAGENAPPTLRFQTGGGTTVRGFGENQITLYSGPACPAPVPVPSPDTGCTEAIGGNLLYLANLETRVLFERLGVVLFVDAGAVQDVHEQVLTNWLVPNPGRLEVSVGAGLRYATSLGSIRVDFGYRVRNPEQLRRWDLFGEPGCECALHLGLGEVY